MNNKNEEVFIATKKVIHLAIFSVFGMQNIVFKKYRS